MAQARVRQAKRAGGHIATPHGWRLVTQATPEELGDVDQPDERLYTAEEVRKLEDEPSLTADESVEPSAVPEPASEQRDRENCPDCGKQVAVNKDGTLRKHTCVIEAPPPAVTFDGEGEEHGGDSASEGW